MVLDFYRKVQEVLQSEKRLVLMVVIANEGSSPGRKGFKMLVTKNQMYGTIGKMARYIIMTAGLLWFFPGQYTP